MRPTGAMALALAISIGLAGCSGKPDADNKPADPTKGGPAGKQGGSPASSGVPAGKNALDLTYVADNFFAAVVVHPKRIADNPLLASLPQDDLLKGVVRELHIDPRKMEQMIVLADPEMLDQRGLGPSVPAVIVRFAEPLDAKAFFAEQFGRVEETTIAGKPCFSPSASDADAPACYAPNDRTMVAARGTVLARMLKADGASSPLIDLLRQADGSADVIAAVLVDPIRSMVQATVDDAKQHGDIPPQAAELAGSVGDLQAASVALNLRGDTLLAVRLVAKDADAAGKLEATATKGVADLKKLLDQFRPMINDNAPPEMAGPLLKLADNVLKGISVGKQTQHVVVTVQRPEGVGEAVEALKPAIAAAQQAAKRAEAMNRLKQIGLAFHMFHAAHGGLPAQAVRDKEGKPLLSWRVAILQFIEDKSLYDQFHLDEPWDSEHNKGLLDKMPEVYKSLGVDAPGMTTMMVFAGDGTVFSGDKAPSFAGIKDGLSNTILAVQAGPDKAVPWTKPEDLPLDKQNPIAALGQSAEGGFIVLFCDGSVRTISADVDAQTLRRMIQPDDGEPIESKE